MSNSDKIAIGCSKILSFSDMNYLDFGCMRRNAFVFLTKRKSRAFTSGYKDKLQEQIPCFQSRQMALKDKKERCTLGVALWRNSWTEQLGTSLTLSSLSINSKYLEKSQSNGVS